MKNALEETVNAVYGELLQKHAADFCSCAQCRDDVIVHALNHARPRYIGTPIGAAVTRVNLSHNQARAEIAVLVYDAMKRVHANPRHGPGQSSTAGGGAR
jgi:competence protein ComFB